MLQCNGSISELSNRLKLNALMYRVAGRFGAANQAQGFTRCLHLDTIDDQARVSPPKTFTISPVRNLAPPGSCALAGPGAHAGSRAFKRGRAP